MSPGGVRRCAVGCVSESCADDGAAAFADDGNAGGADVVATDWGWVCGEPCTGDRGGPRVGGEGVDVPSCRCKEIRPVVAECDPSGAFDAVK